LNNIKIKEHEHDKLSNECLELLKLKPSSLAKFILLNVSYKISKKKEEALFCELANKKEPLP